MKSKYYVLTSEGNSHLHRAKREGEYMTIKEIRRDLKQEINRLLNEGFESDEYQDHFIKDVLNVGNFSEDPVALEEYDEAIAEWEYYHEQTPRENVAGSVKAAIRQAFREQEEL